MVGGVSVGDCSGALGLKGEGRDAVISRIRDGEERPSFKRQQGWKQAPALMEVAL